MATRPQYALSLGVVPPPRGAKKALLAAAGVAVLAGPLAIGLCHGTVAEASAAPFTPESQPFST